MVPTGLNASISHLHRHCDNITHNITLYCTRNTKRVHVLGLEGHMHDTNTSPKTNCVTTIEETIYKNNSRVEQSNNNYIS